jgi:hypothetical protein
VFRLFVVVFPACLAFHSILPGGGAIAAATRILTYNVEQRAHKAGL